jgi:hypothetical protein
MAIIKGDNMSKWVFIESKITLLGLLTAALTLTTPGVKAFAADPPNAASDPYPWTDTFPWEFAGAELRWWGKGPDGLIWNTPNRKGLTDAVPVFRLRNWKPGLIEKLPVPKGPFRIAFAANATDGLLKELSRLKTLESLDLFECSEVTDSGLKSLAGLTELKELKLVLQRQVSQWVIFGHGRQRTYVGSILPNFTHGAVVLGLTKLTAAGLRGLSPLKKVQSLDLMCDDITDAGLKELSAMKSLKRIILGECDRLTDAGIAEFQRSLPHCEIRR